MLFVFCGGRVCTRTGFSVAGHTVNLDGEKKPDYGYVLWFSSDGRFIDLEWHSTRI